MSIVGHLSSSERPAHRLPMRWQWALSVFAAAMAVVLLALLFTSSVAGAEDFPSGPLFAVGGLAAFAFSAAAYGYSRKIERRIEFSASLLWSAAHQAANEGQKRHGHMPQADPAETMLDQLEDATRAVSRTLHSLAVERRHSRDLVDREGQAKVQFLAAMSHELRTPLNAILGYGTLLLEDAVDRKDDVAGADLERIGIAGRRLLDLIDNLLELSGMQPDGGSMRRSLASLAEIVAAACSEVEDGDGATCNLVTESIDEDVFLVTDRKRCARAIRNLIDAALTHSQGDVVLRASHDANAAQIRVSIMCPGWKLDNNEIERLFDGPGAQRTSGKYNRELVALAVSRSLARRLDGDCHALANPGGGIVLVLALPLDANSSESREVDTNALIAARDRQLALAEHANGPKVLVIDDDLAAIDLLGRWLRRLDCFVLEATSGKDGLVLARQGRPDLILLDALMPERTGYDILTEMRNDSGLRDTPVVLVTVDDDRMRGIDAGASDFVRKPISEAQLGAIMQTYCQSVSGEILVIDDDEDAVEIMCRNLERLGFKSIRAAEGQEGLELARTRRPSAIVLDLQMPGIDGFAFIEQIAKDAKLADVPVIVVSGLDLSLAQHFKLSQAGYRFFNKGQTAPREIVDTLKELVA